MKLSDSVEKFTSTTFLKILLLLEAVFLVIFRRQMKFRFALILVVSVCVKSFGQNHVVDSLKNVLKIHTDDDSLRVILLNQLAFERYFDYPTEAANYSIDAGRIADKINYAPGRAQSFRMLGLTFWAQANLSAALNYFVKGLKIADSIRNRQIQADITGNIGLVYIGMDNYSTALNFFKSSIDKQRALKNIVREAAMLNNIGDCYFKMKKYDSALITYREGIRIGRLKNFGIATNIRNIGNVYEAMSEPDKALSYYYRAKSISDSLSDHRGMTLVRKSIASVLFFQGQYLAAEKLTNECLSIATPFHLKAVARDCYILLSDIAKAQGHTDLSFKYFRLFVLYKDSIQNLSESAKIASLQLEYETHQKQQEINSLKKESELKNSLLFSAVAGILVVLFLLISSAQNYYRTKQRNVEIIALNEEIKKRESEVILQRDALVEKNLKIESLHAELSEINKNLERLIGERTEVLKDQNKHLESYAFMTAHNLRAPLARVMGIVNLLEKETATTEQKLLFDHLRTASCELDSVIRSISGTLQEGMSAYDSVNTTDKLADSI